MNWKSKKERTKARAAGRAAKKARQEKAKKALEAIKNKEVVNTNSFWQKQSFGPASEVRRISVEEYERQLKK